MSRIIFMADPDAIAEVEGDPANHFPCIRGMGVHVDARVQLYSLAMGMFLDDAAALEETLYDWSTDSLTLNRLAPELTQRLAQLDEHAVTELLGHWAESKDVEDLGLSMADLEEYLFGLVNLCQQARDGGSEVFVLTDH